MTSTTIVQLNSEDLRTELRELINEILSEREIKTSEPTLPERGGIELAEQILNRSKSWIYKATSQGVIPHKKFGSRCLFSRSELEQWLSQRAIDPSHSLDEIDAALQQSARKKLSKI